MSPPLEIDSHPRQEALVVSPKLTKSPKQSTNDYRNYRSHAEAILPVHVSPTDVSLQAIVRRLCPDLFPEQQSTLRVRSLTGGLSNELFVVASGSQSVLVRLHPVNDQDQDDIVDRDVENRLVAYLAQQESPKVPMFYGRFLNGRIEELYDNVVPLSCQEMNEYASSIGKLMGQVHAQNKVPTCILSIDKESSCGQVWDRVDTWLRRVQVRSDLRETLSREWKWCKQAVPNLGGLGSEIVLCHMDVQSLNLLKQSSDDDDNDEQLLLIDYEYAGFNPRFVDIGNTFCEFCDMNNLKPDYQNEYPQEVIQDEFLRAYFAAIGHDTSPSDEYLAELRHDVGRYTVVSCIMWAIWALLQNERNKTLHFDYLKYAQLRLEGYYYFRDRFWQQP